MIKKNIILSLILVLLPGTGLFAEEKITLVYTNSLNGNFDFCHCKKDPRGGLVKRAGEINKIRKSYKNVFLFETGDMFPAEEDNLIAKYLIKGYKYIKYDSIMFGDQEFLIGIEKFLKFKSELPFVCNNVLLKGNDGWKNYFKRFLIINKNNIKIGVIGSISKIAFKYHPKAIKSNIRITDQIKEIKKDIKNIKGEGVKFIILLSHSGYDEDKILLKKIKGIDVIIGGHSQSLIKKPVKTGDAIVVQAGSNGANIGILELTVRNGSIKSFRNSFRLPDEFKPDDEYIRGLINEYEKEVNEEYKKMRFN